VLTPPTRPNPDVATATSGFSVALPGRAGMRHARGASHFARREHRARAQGRQVTRDQVMAQRLAPLPTGRSKDSQICRMLKFLIEIRNLVFHTGKWLGRNFIREVFALAAEGGDPRSGAPLASAARPPPRRAKARFLCAVLSIL
jgi:hypothetical protein